MKKIISIIAISILLLASCTFFSSTFGGIFTPAIPWLGAVLTVDSSNHFKEDIVYRSGQSTYTFGSDGTYEYKYERYEDAGEDWDGDGLSGEDWVMTSGKKGTYTWDAETMILERIITREEDQGEFVLLSDKTTQRETMYFTESHWGEAAAQSSSDKNQWITTYERSVQNGSTYTWDVTVTINISSGSYKYEYSSHNKNADGDTTSRYMEEVTGTYEILPEGTKFVRGNQMTVLATITLYRDRSYDTVNDEWNSWVEDNDQYKESRPIVHMGSFIIADDGPMSERSLSF